MILQTASTCLRSLPLGALVLGLTGTFQPSLGQPGSPLATPAEFVKHLSPPGESSHFRRPAAVVHDRHHAEILVVDLGRRRVVIFDDQGLYRFEFGATEEFPTPVDAAVDSEGYIYILGLVPGGREVFKYDFDGVAIGRVELESDHPLDIHSLTVDAHDHLLLFDQLTKSMRIHGHDGQLVGDFRVAPSLPADMRDGIVVGDACVKDDEIYVPIPSLGTVHVYGHQGGFRRAIGHQGTDIGELNFPVAVSVTDSGLVVILDKHRFNVVCFDRDGTFQGEFGGRGLSDGWFYHPTLLASLGEDRVVIGQVFQNRMQVCRIPDALRARHRDYRRGLADPPSEALQVFGGGSPENDGRIPIE